MTETYYECIIHGRQHVDEIEIRTVRDTFSLGAVETVYKLECGCEIVSRLPSSGNAFK